MMAIWCWLKGHDDVRLGIPLGVLFAPDWKCRRCGRFL